jgi:hypothetical protein
VGLNLKNRKNCEDCWGERPEEREIKSSRSVLPYGFRSIFCLQPVRVSIDLPAISLTLHVTLLCNSRSVPEHYTQADHDRLLKNPTLFPIQKIYLPFSSNVFSLWSWKSICKWLADQWIKQKLYRFVTEIFWSWYSKKLWGWPPGLDSLQGQGFSLLLSVQTQHLIPWVQKALSLGTNRLEEITQWGAS